MIRFYIYRFKLLDAPQKNNARLLPIQVSKSGVLKKIILMRPGAFVRKGIEWTMADSEELGDGLIFFKFGRITKKQKDKFDRDSRSFYEMIDDDIDKVACFYDANFQVLAIEKNNSAPTPNTISKYISKIVTSCKDLEYIKHGLTADEFMLLNLTNAKIDAISDPLEFIEYLKKSYKVTRFEVFLGKDNPYDFEETLQRPMQRYLKDVEGEEAGTFVSSREGLNKNKIIDIAKAAAAYGENATAKVY